jgi:membrane-bound lytic murein transglycosylase D
MIQRVLQNEGIPQELIHLAQAESGFIPRAVSRKAAGGMWQFVVFRGRQYGLFQTPSTDDRMDPEMATRAAAHHLHDLYNEFGDWYLAIAAYNCGPGVIEKAVERTGYADFWELRRRGALPAETTNYVPIILAMTIMEKNAAEYGLEGIQLDTPLEYDTVPIDAPTSLALVSDIADLPSAEIAALNPAALKTVFPQGYLLHVPKGTGNQVSEALASVPAAHRAVWRMHTVAADETIASIAKLYGVSAANIEANNDLSSGAPAIGARLLIPSTPRPEPRAIVARSGSRASATAHSSPRHSANSARKASAKTAPKTVARVTPARKAAVVIASATAH